jgi:O-antigen/teichoic acid export membrane protein
VRRLFSLKDSSLAIGGIFLSLIFSILIVRILTVEDRGLLQLFLTCAQFSFIVGGLGLAFSKALYEGKYNTLISSKFDIILISPIIFLVSIGYSIYYNVDFFNYQYWFLMFSFTLNLYSIDRTKNKYHYKEYSVIFFYQPLIALLIISVGYFYKIDLDTIILSYCGSNFLSSLIWFCKKQPNLNKADFNKFKLLPFKIWLNSLTSFFANNIDKLIILKLLSLWDVGVYMTMTSIAAILSKIFERFAVRTLSLFQSGNMVMKKIILISFFVLVITLPIIYTLVLFFGDFLIINLFGAKYAGNALLLANIAVGTLICSISWLIAQKLISDLHIFSNLLRTVGSTLVFLISLYLASLVVEVSVNVVSLCFIVASLYRYFSTILLVSYYEEN